MSGSATAAEPRTLAPPERRVATVTGVERLGAYVVVRALDPGPAPIPHPGQFYMLAPSERWGGVEDGRPYLPRAFSHARATPRPGGRRAVLPARGGGSRHHPPGSARARRGTRVSWARSGSGSDRRRPARGRCSWAAGSARRRSSASRTSWATRPRSLLGFRSLEHARAAELFRGEVGPGHRRRELGPPRSRHGAAARAARRRRRAHRLRVRAAAHARGGEGALRRARRARPAGARVGHGLRFRRVLRVRGAHPGRLPAAVRGRAGAGCRPARNRARARRGALRVARASSWPACAGRARAERLGHVRRDRRAACLRRRAARALPVPRVRVEDDHRRAAPGQSAAAPVGDARRDDQLDRAARTRAWRGSCDTTCRAWPSCPCRWSCR